MPKNSSKALKIKLREKSSKAKVSNFFYYLMSNKDLLDNIKKLREMTGLVLKIVN